ncbi:MAG: hypothetical protein ABFD25_18750 [Clostridiaceae bacterium]
MTVEDQEQQDGFSLCQDTAVVYSLVDQVAEGVVKLVNASNDHQIACHRGCNTCCTVFVMATYAEAAEIAKWLLSPSQTETLNRFRKQMELWHTIMGPKVELLGVLSTKHNGRPTVEPDAQLYGEALKAYHQRLFMCPFNAGDGSCGIYPIRPVVCRTFYVADSCEYCTFNGNGEITIVRHATLTEVALLARHVLRELSAAAGNDSLSALPSAVAQALAIMQGDC